MKNKPVMIMCLALYSLILLSSSFILGRITHNANGEIVKQNRIEEVYTAKEEEGKLTIYQGEKVLMSLDTQVELLPEFVRMQLKTGIDFKASELPELMEAFAE